MSLPVFVPVAVGACAAMLLAACGTKAAQETSRKPALSLTGRVVDAADILDPTLEQQLTKRLEAIERDTGAQFVVATTPSLGKQPINIYSIDLARSCGIGSKERNDGLLLLVAPHERNVRIEVGKGLERTLPDELCAHIIQANMIPRFKADDLAGGIQAGVNALDAALRKRHASANDNHIPDRNVA